MYIVHLLWGGLHPAEDINKLNQKKTPPVKALDQPVIKYRIIQGSS